MLFRHRWADVCAGRGRLSSLVSFRSVLLSLDLGEAWYACASGPGWTAVVRSKILHNQMLVQRAEICSHPSLALYRELNHDCSSGLHPFLDDRDNIQGTRLKAQVRHGTLWVLQRVASSLNWSSTDGACLLCRTGDIEDTEHFLCHCPSLVHLRVDLLSVLSVVLPQAGIAGAHLLSAFKTKLASYPTGALALLAGSPCRLICPVSTDVDAHVEQCAKAEWLFDKASKNYIRACWRFRKSRLGSIKVVDGKPVLDQTNVVSSFSAPKIAKIALPALTSESRHRWATWIPRVRPAYAIPSKTNAFYVVWYGKRTGRVFYKWCDAFSSFAGRKGAQCKGYLSLKDAYTAASRPPPVIRRIRL